MANIEKSGKGFLFDLQACYNQYVKHELVDVEDEKENEKNLAKIGRVYLTPTFSIFRAPEIDITNRVVRHFIHKRNHFLRMSIVTDTCEQQQNVGENMCEYYKDILLNGIEVGTKKYLFLAFSNSQLRGSSCWMFRACKKISLDSIYSWMGDFSKEQNLAKYASRMGLAFSTTYEAISIPSTCIEEIPDIKIQEIVDPVTLEKRKVDYCFSDGVGTISESLIIKSVEVLGEKYASAIQCRFGGCKGVFSIDPSLKGDKIRIRPSQTKFKSNHLAIEIIGCSKFHYGHLNRQVILLLATQKVLNEVFINLMNEHVEMLKELLKGNISEETQSIALDGSFQEISDIIQRMINSQFNPCNEPFLRAINRTIFCRSLNELRKRERILIKKSACLLGIMDETGTLEYGQVFCRVSKKNDPTIENDKDEFKNGNFTVTGDVVISKNPCLFAGDIRVLQAVDAKNLYHYINVVVFPSKGKRPHPNETSGSDLDGDVYFISWEHTLLPKPENRVPPAEFPAAAGAKKEKIERKEIITFFANYLKGSFLGKIANAHLVFADQSPQLALDEHCVNLAAQHSIEVDFPKTGVHGQLTKDDRLTAYPDFLEKENTANVYESQSILGIIYRKAKAIQNGLVSQNPEEFDIKIEVNKDLVVEGYEKYYDLAKYNYSLYAQDLLAIMKQYGIKSELELISGNVSDLSKFHTVKKDKDDIMDRIGKHLTIKIQQHKTTFEQGLKSAVEKLQKASAYYIVAYDIRGEYALKHQYKTKGKTLILKHYIMDIIHEMMERAMMESDCKENVAPNFPAKGKGKGKSNFFLSFPWLIVGKLLCKIKNDSAKQF